MGRRVAATDMGTHRLGSPEILRNALMGARRGQIVRTTVLGCTRLPRPHHSWEASTLAISELLANGLQRPACRSCTVRLAHIPVLLSWLLRGQCQPADHPLQPDPPCR